MADGLKDADASPVTTLESAPRFYVADRGIGLSAAIGLRQTGHHDRSEVTVAESACFT
jgi:hypothetical protein